jgi:hypothetical protein
VMNLNLRGQITSPGGICASRLSPEDVKMLIPPMACILEPFCLEGAVLLLITRGTVMTIAV